MTQLEIENLGKQYLLSNKSQIRGNYAALRDVLSDAFARTKNKNFLSNNDGEKFWALKDVSFRVEKGEKLGIIGKNGSGKTTLLRLLSRITEPTSGEIRINGTVSSLLEVGTGFHPELTGRENIFLNGAILGMSRKDISNRFDEIVAFSETEKFLDIPVKRYSSGMYLRLAFSVAAHLETDTLLIDEVLAVGDASFQKKCLGKMDDSTQSDKSILFVSHNMNAIKQLCDKVIWLDNGQIAGYGPTDEVVNEYLKSVQGSSMVRNWEEGSELENNDVKIESIRIVPSGDTSILTTDDPFNIEFLFYSKEDFNEVNLSFVLWSITGECVFNVASEVMKAEKGLYKGVCKVPSNLLNNNIYSIEMMVIKDRSYAIFKQKDILTFEIVDGKRVKGWYGKWVGVVRPSLDFELDRIKG